MRSALNEQGHNGARLHVSWTPDRPSRLDCADDADRVQAKRGGSVMSDRLDNELSY